MESNEPPYLLLSVNNSLVPKGKDSQFHRHFNYVSEGRPLNFFSGYGGSDYWMTDLILFLQKFFEIENYAEAKHILDELERLYYAQLDPFSPVNGHFYQFQNSIAIPANLMVGYLDVRYLILSFFSFPFYFRYVLFWGGLSPGPAFLISVFWAYPTCRAWRRCAFTVPIFWLVCLVLPTAVKW